jgi:hypothetical protein
VDGRGKGRTHQAQKKHTKDKKAKGETNHLQPHKNQQARKTKTNSQKKNIKRHQDQAVVHAQQARHNKSKNFTDGNNNIN